VQSEAIAITQKATLSEFRPLVTLHRH